MQIKTVGVVGAGQMGLGIAQVFATAGYQVVLSDQSAEAIQQGLLAIERSLSKLEKKGLLTVTPQTSITPQASIAPQASITPQDVMTNISVASSLDDMATAQLVIEAIAENESAKQGLLAELDQLCGEDTILATNTSSISITRLALSTQRPDKVIGMHFMNPVPVIPLLEVINSVLTSDETTDAIYSLAPHIGKTCVMSQDRPGFIVNRILIPMINEAIFVLDEGIASAEEIDRAMVLGTAQPIGPLALADLIGLDTCLSIMQVLYEGFQEPKYRPSPLLKQMVDSRLLGRKTKQGFFDYE